MESRIKMILAKFTENRNLAFLRGMGLRKHLKTLVLNTRKAEFAFRTATAGYRQDPNFIILGTVKGGTTSLYWQLSSMENINASFSKEVNYFNMNYEKGLSWYKAHFPIQAGITGEASPLYFLSGSAAERMKEMLPDVRLLLLLREPVARAYSEYNMSKKYGWEKRGFSTAVEEELEYLQHYPLDVENYDEWVNGYGNLPYIAPGVYVKFYQMWLDKFSREQILVIRSEDYWSSRRETMQRIYNHIGLRVRAVNAPVENRNKNSYDPLAPDVREKIDDFFLRYNNQLNNLLEYEFL